jgi:hypothetical protein
LREHFPAFKHPLRNDGFGSPGKAIMKLGPTLLTLLSGLCVSTALASAQSAICGGDGEANSNAAPVACVTGTGVQVTTAPAAGERSDAAPLAPEQRPAEVPNVTYINGRLRVVTKNSTLSDILQAIAARTGAAIDIPEGANERVVTQLGPAPARDVIAALLNGSHYNYVLVGTEADAEDVARVIVTAKAEKADTGTAVAGNTRPGIQARNALQAAVMQPYQEMLQQQQAQQAAAQEMQAQINSEIAEQANQQTSNDASANANSNTAAAGSSDAGAGAGVTQAAPDAPAGADTPRAGNGSNAEKTPQQMLQDLYETRKQMIQQQHQPPPQQ